MKEVHCFTLQDSRSPPGAVNAILEIARAVPGKHGIHTIRMDGDDPCLPVILSALDEFAMGRKPDYKRGESAFSCLYDIYREYSDTDFAAVDFLYIWRMDAEPWSGWLTPDGESLLLTKESAPKRRRLSWFASTGQPLCVESIKQRLERERFVGLKFRPAILMEKAHLPASRTQIAWEDWGSEPWYQIISDLRLPPLAPTMDLRDVNRQPARERGVWPREGSYVFAELHYLEHDIRALGPFDVAMTHEMMYGYNETFRRLIVSQRFYQLARELGLAWEFLPVRLDTNP